MPQNIIEQLVDYSRQSEMTMDLGNLMSRRHVIVGVGGIGYWLGIQLAMLGATTIVLIDADRVEPSNLNRIPVPLRMRGEYKVKALKAQIRMLRPTCHITCLPVHITADTLSMVNAGSVHVWDCTDDARIQRIISRHAQDQGYGYTKAGYEGWDIGLYNKMEDTWLQDDYAPGYTSSKANVISSMMAAGLAILYAGQYVDTETRINLHNLVHEGASVPVTEEPSLEEALNG